MGMWSPGWYSTLVVFICTCVLHGARSIHDDDQAPRFLNEPPPKLHFLNTIGAVLHCGPVSGFPVPTVTLVTIPDRISVSQVPQLRTLYPNGTMVLHSFSAVRYRQDVHSATYRCIAQNSIGITGSRDVRVRAVVNQRYEVQVYDEFVSLGNTAVLRCHVPSYVRDYIEVTSWQREDGESINEKTKSDRFKILKHGELHIRNVQVEDAFKAYRCLTHHRLSGVSQLSSTAGRLIITESAGTHPPKLSDTVTNFEAVEGTSTMLFCVAQSNPPPQYRWYRKEPWALAVDVIPTAKQQFGSLSIDRVRLEDSGQYVCVVNNSAGEQRLEVTLTITAPLSVRVKPENIKIVAGVGITLDCNVSGYPIESIYWLKDQQPIHQILSTDSGRISLKTPQKLEITSLSRAEKGVYQCYAKNSRDSAQGTTEIILGDIPPAITSAFSHRVLDTSTSVSLQCVASGTPLPQVTWTKDGFPVQDNERVRAGDYVRRQGDVVSHVNITDLRVEDGAFYACVAKSDVGVAMHQARLDVQGPPTVRKMSDHHIVASERVYIQCPYSGYPISEVFWEKDGRRLPTNRRQHVFSNGTLLLTEVVQDSDEGVYRCTVRNKDATADSGTLRIKVQVKPVLLPFNFPKVIQEGMKVVVTCSILKGDPPFEIYWLKNSQKIAPDSVFEEDVRIQKFTDDLAGLTIEKVSPKHNGDYTCSVKNGFAVVNHTATLTVQVPPRWTIEPRDRDVVLGRSATLDCQADGHPPPQLRWEKGTGSGQYQPVTTSYHYQIYENGSLTIQDVQKEDAGFYLCQATNDVGPGLSSVITLSVRVAPEFQSKFQTRMVNKGEDVRLSCHVKGDLPMRIQWHKDKSPLLGPTTNTDGRSTHVREEPVEEGARSELSIRNAGRSDSALYSCVATNKFGTDDTNIQLIVQEPPDPPRNVQIHETNSRSVVVIWAPPFSGNSLIKHYIIQYRETGGLPSNVEHNVTIPSTETKTEVKHLRPSTSYELSMMAENAVGVSLPSMKIPFQTDGEVPEGPPENIAIEATSSTTFKVSWTPPPRHLQNGDILGYYVGYSEHVTGSGLGTGNATGNAFQYKTVDAPSESTSAPRLETELKGLRKWTRYAVVIQAFNKKGSGPRSDPVIKSTLEDVPSRPPRKVNCVPTSSQRIRVTWLAPPHAHLHGHLEGFKVRYRRTDEWEDDDEETTQEVMLRGTDPTETYLENLGKYRNYSITVLATTRRGDGVESEPVFCRTLEDAPGPPADIKAVAQRPDAILISWREPEEPNGLLLKYTLYQRTVSADKQLHTNVSKHTTAPHTLYYEATNLKREQRYEFWVTSSTIVGEGDSTKVLSHAPNDIIPARVSSFSSRILVTKGKKFQLPCRIVGIPQPTRSWFFKNSPLPESGISVLANGSLQVEKMSDDLSGNYTCRVENKHGSDEIVYHVRIRGVLPAPGNVAVIDTSSTSLTLQWEISPRYTARIHKLVLHYRKKFKYGGVWEEADIRATVAHYTLEGLQCGTKYLLYLTGVKRNGALGDQSTIITASTDGQTPIAPPVDDFAVSNISSITLVFSAWADGGCVIRSFSAMYRLQEHHQQRQEWIPIAIIWPTNDRISIYGLQQATWYEIKVTATNDAGSQVHIYTVATLTHLGGTIAPVVGPPMHGRGGFLEEAQILAPLLTIIFAVTIVATVLTYICFRRKHHLYEGTDMSVHGNGIYETSQLDRGPSLHNSEQHKKYIEAEQQRNSPNHVTLSPYQHPNKILPQNHLRSNGKTNHDTKYYEEDVAPYATFRIAGECEDGGGAGGETTCGAPLKSRDTSAAQLVDDLQNQYQELFAREKKCRTYDSSNYLNRAIPLHSSPCRNRHHQRASATANGPHQRCADEDWLFAGPYDDLLHYDFSLSRSVEQRYATTTRGRAKSINGMVQVTALDPLLRDLCDAPVYDTARKNPYATVARRKFRGGQRHFRRGSDPECESSADDSSGAPLHFTDEPPLSTGPPKRRTPLATAGASLRYPW